MSKRKECDNIDPDTNFDKANREYQRQNISEDVGEW